jgi:hypothetical protein
VKAVIDRLRALLRQHFTGQTFLFSLNLGVLILQVVSDGIRMEERLAIVNNMQEIAPKITIQEENFPLLKQGSIRK